MAEGALKARVILVSGKGGVGKTTVAAATAVAAARRGYRTLVMSLDIAHSLADSFNLDRGLFNSNAGRPWPVAPNLDVQEIDVHEEISRHWKEVYKYLADIFSTTGLEDAVAEEVAVIPGTEDVIALMYINQYVTEHAYDVIVLDAPPTGESLRFVSIQSTLQWYMRKRFNLDRNLVKLAGPLLSRIADAPMPDDSYFTGVQRMFQRMQGVDDLLVDPRITTVRLVTNAEKMVVRETQRAYMYFSLYGMTTDQVIVNRLMPAQTGADGYFAGWADQQATYTDQIREYFDPVPVSTLPLFPREVLGLDGLRRVADALYADCDPAEVFLDGPPYSFAKRGSLYSLRVKLPFAAKGDLNVTRIGEDLVIRLGAFKRHVPLPRAMQPLKVSRSAFEDGALRIDLQEGPA